MDDETLARYLPALGDRMALKSYCTKQAGSNSHDGKNTNHVRKNVLLEKLRKKMKLKQSSAVSSDSSDDENHSQHKVGKSMVGNKYAAKSNRKIEFGWIHNGRQVRVRGGGGTRKISVPKNMDCEGLLKIGKDLFFPDGQSKKGNEKEFIFKIWDFKENVLPLGVTVGDVYEKVKMGIVRFYLASLDQNRVETTVQVVDNVLEERSSTVDCNVPFDAAESAQVHLPEKVSMHPVSETCTSNSSRNVRSDSLKEMPASHCFLTDSAATECDIGLCSSGNIITSAFVSAIFSSDSEVEFYPFNVESEVCDDTVPWVTPGIPNEYQPVPTSLKPMLETNNPIVCSTPEHRPPNSPVRQEQLITFITSSTPAPSSALQQVHPLPPNSTPAPSSPPLQLSDVYYVTLHRVIIVKDIL